MKHTLIYICSGEAVRRETSADCSYTRSQWEGVRGEARVWGGWREAGDRSQPRLQVRTRTLLTARALSHKPSASAQFTRRDYSGIYYYRTCSDVKGVSSFLCLGLVSDEATRERHCHINCKDSSSSIQEAWMWFYTRFFLQLHDHGFSPEVHITGPLTHQEQHKAFHHLQSTTIRKQPSWWSGVSIQFGSESFKKSWLEYFPFWVLKWTSRRWKVSYSWTWARALQRYRSDPATRNLYWLKTTEKKSTANRKYISNLTPEQRCDKKKPQELLWSVRRQRSPAESVQI